MLWHGIALIVGVATVMTALALQEDEYYKKIASSGTALFLWLAAAAGSPQITFTYQKVIENTTENAMTIIKTGTQQISGAVSWLSWAWLGMAIITALYLWYSVSAQASEEMR